MLRPYRAPPVSTTYTPSLPPPPYCPRRTSGSSTIGRDTVATW